MKKIYLNKEKKQALPYALNGLKVKNFQGIIDLEIDELPCDAQWIFLVGENGFGKTSVLRAIAEKLTETSVDLTFLRAILDHIKEIWYFCNRTNDFKKYKNEILPAVGYGISRFNMSINIKADINPFASLFQENAV